LRRLFRALNVLGNAALVANYDVTTHHRPGQSWWRRWLVNPAMSFVIFWTYPQALEQKAPLD
jgi:hypothetical protein